MNSRIKNVFALNFPVSSFAFWLMVAYVFPVWGGLISIMQALRIAIFFFASVGAGALITQKIPYLDKVPVLIRTGFSFILGSTILFILLSFFKSNIVISFVAILCLILCVWPGKLTMAFDKLGLAAVLPAVLLWINREELTLALSPVFQKLGVDYFYYEALVVSLRETLSVFDSVFHKGVSVNYATLPFFSPATLSHFTGISGHVAYSSIYAPVLKMLSLGTLASGAVYAFSHFSGNTQLSWKQFAGAAVAFLFLVPLHPVYLAKMDLKNAIFLGEGTTWAAGHMGVAISIMLLGLNSFYLFRPEKKWLDHLTFMILTAAIAICKVSMFFPFVIFYGIYFSIAASGRARINGISTTFVAFAVGYLLSNIFTRNDAGMTSVKFHAGGYYLEYFKAYAPAFHLPATTVGSILLFLFMLIPWMGYKTVLFNSSLRMKNKHLTALITAAVITMLVSALPPWFMQILLVDEHKKLLVDGTFDTVQFFKAGWFITTYAGVAALLFVWNNWRSKCGLVLKIATTSWFIIACVSFFAIFTERPLIIPSKWEDEVVEDYVTYRPKLMAISPTPQCSGQILVTREVTPWWICCTRSNFYGSYLNTLEPNYRNKMLVKLFSDSAVVSEKEKILAQMAGEGVDAIVATPENIGVCNRLVASGYLKKPAGSNWLFIFSTTSIKNAILQRTPYN